MDLSPRAIRAVLCFDVCQEPLTMCRPSLTFLTCLLLSFCLLAACSDDNGDAINNLTPDATTSDMAADMAMSDASVDIQMDVGEDTTTDTSDDTDATDDADAVEDMAPDMPEVMQIDIPDGPWDITAQGPFNVGVRTLELTYMPQADPEMRRVVSRVWYLSPIHI